MASDRGVEADPVLAESDVVVLAAVTAAVAPFVECPVGCWPPAAADVFAVAVVYEAVGCRLELEDVVVEAAALKLEVGRIGFAGAVGGAAARKDAALVCRCGYGG